MSALCGCIERVMPDGESGCVWKVAEQKCSKVVAAGQRCRGGGFPADVGPSLPVSRYPSRVGGCASSFCGYKTQQPLCFCLR